MKRIFTVFIVFLSIFYINAQSYNYAWLTDLHIGSPGADKDLLTVVEKINFREDISFVVITGDIAEKGKNSELEKTFEILGLLKMPYYIIKGNHDTKWSESGGTKFSDLWGEDHFIFSKGNHLHAGLSSGIIWRGAGGHITPEDISWLHDTLESVNPEKLFLYLHHPPDGDIDNWFKLINVIKDHNPVLIFTGHGHSNKVMNFSGIPGVMSRSILSAKAAPGFTLVSVTTDSVLFSEINSEGIEKKWHSIELKEKSINKIDSLQFINYSASEVVKKEFGTTISAPLFTADGRIFISTYSKGIICTDYRGDILWTYDPHGTILSKPVFFEGILVSATAEGDLFSLEAHTGKLIQVIGLGESITSQLDVIDVDYNNKKTKGIIAGTGNGNLYCYDLYTFEMIWENNSSAGMIETKPLYIDGKIIFGSWDGYLYCINSSSGVMNWKWTENNNFYYSPAACYPVSDGKRIYIATPDKYISAVDILLGVTVWRKNNYDAWETIQLSSDKQYLYVKSMKDNFFVISAKDGKEVKKIEIKFGLDTVPSPPVETGQEIIFGSRNGKIYSIKKEDFTWKELLFTGTARIHSVILLENGKIAAVNMDGTFITAGTGL